MQIGSLPIYLSVACAIGLAVGLLVAANLLNPARGSAVKRAPYESGMDPIHEARRRFDVRFYLVAIAFLVFDVELVFLYPWAVATRPALMETDKNADAVPTGIDAAVIVVRSADNEFIISVFIYIACAGH